MNLTSLALAKHDKNVLQNVGVSPPKSGWALSDRLDWAGRRCRCLHQLGGVAYHARETTGAGLGSPGRPWPTWLGSRLLLPR